MRARKNKTTLVVLAVMLFLGIAGSTAAWYFLFRKNPETVAQIEKINQTQSDVDQALGWDDGPDAAQK